MYRILMCQFDTTAWPQRGESRQVKPFTSLPMSRASYRRDHDEQPQPRERARDQRREFSRQIKLFTYLPMSNASCMLTPDGWPLPNLGLNWWYGPIAAATNA